MLLICSVLGAPRGLWTMDSYSDYSLMEYLLPWWKYLLKLLQSPSILNTAQEASCIIQLQSPGCSLSSSCS